MKRNIDWKEEVTARYLEHFNKGYSHAWIAGLLNAEFHLELTRCACIGKAHRLGLPQRKGRSGNSPDIAPRGDVKVKFVTSKPKPAKVITPKVLGPLPITLPDAPEGVGITFEDLHSLSCKWPFASGLYCGETTTNTRSSWCAYHRLKATKPPGAKESHYAAIAGRAA